MKTTRPKLKNRYWRTICENLEKDMSESPQMVQFYIIFLMKGLSITNKTDLAILKELRALQNKVTEQIVNGVKEKQKYLEIISELEEEIKQLKGWDKK